MTDRDRAEAAEPPAEPPPGEREIVAPPAALDSAAPPASEARSAPAAPPPRRSWWRRAKKERTTWLDDVKAILWLLLAVLAFHSCVAKPFYIPSESMMPGLLKGDRLVVSKYPYGWSWVSPSFHVFPPWRGRIWGAMPRRGDVVIVTPPEQSDDYIKRVIGIPGDRVQVIDGTVYLNRRPLVREARGTTMIPADGNVPCEDDGGRWRTRGGDGRVYCRMPVFREYLPDGRFYDTIDSGRSTGDDYPETLVPENHVFLMGDNRDHSADSRFSSAEQGLNGPVPWENVGGRAEFITFSLDGSSSYWNPVSWFTALRGGRSGTSLHPATGPAPRPAAPPPRQGGAR